MVVHAETFNKVWTDRPDHVGIMPILQKDGQNTTFVEEDHRSYQLGPQMYDITDVAGHKMSSIFISVWVKIRHAITVDS